MCLKKPRLHHSLSLGPDRIVKPPLILGHLPYPRSLSHPENVPHLSNPVNYDFHSFSWPFDPLSCPSPYLILNLPISSLSQFRPPFASYDYFLYPLLSEIQASSLCLLSCLASLGLEYSMGVLYFMANILLCMSTYHSCPFGSLLPQSELMVGLSSDSLHWEPAWSLISAFLVDRIHFGLTVYGWVHVSVIPLGFLPGYRRWPLRVPD